MGRVMYQLRPTVFLRTVLCLLTVALLLAAAFLPGCGADTGRLIFGFVAQTVSESLSYQSEKLEEALSETLDVKVQVFAFNSTADLTKALGSAQVDVALLTPFAYVAAHDTFGAQALLRCVRKGKDHFLGEIVALAEGGPASLGDLRGARVGFVSQTSISGYLLPLALLIEEGISPTQDFAEVVFTGGHEEAVRAVLSGELDAAACRVDACSSVYAEAKDVFERVAVIAETGPVPNDTVVVRAGLRPELVVRLKEALERVASGGEGRVAWKAVSRSEGFAEAEDPDYDVVREIAALLGMSFEAMLLAGD